jgi:single-stranded DNA-binding protein
MFNETLLAGTLSVQAESGQTKNGKLLAHARIETTDILDDGRVFKTWVPIVAYSKAAERLLTFNHGDLLIARGKIAWSADQGGLIVACRDISRFAQPAASEEAHAAA